MFWIIRHFPTFLKLCLNALRRGRSAGVNDYYLELQEEDFHND